MKMNSCLTLSSNFKHSNTTLHVCISKSIYYLFVCFIYSPGIHRERRKFLRSALKELALIFTDQPGLLGPKVGGWGGETFPGIDRVCTMYSVYNTHVMWA